MDSPFAITFPSSGGVTPVVIISIVLLRRLGSTWVRSRVLLQPVWLVSSLSWLLLTILLNLLVGSFLLQSLDCALDPRQFGLQTMSFSWVLVGAFHVPRRFIKIYFL